MYCPPRRAAAARAGRHTRARGRVASIRRTCPVNRVRPRFRIRTISPSKPFSDGQLQHLDLVAVERPAEASTRDKYPVPSPSRRSAKPSPPGLTTAKLGGPRPLCLFPYSRARRCRRRNSPRATRDDARQTHASRGRPDGRFVLSLEGSQVPVVAADPLAMPSLPRSATPTRSIIGAELGRPQHLAARRHRVEAARPDCRRRCCRLASTTGVAWILPPVSSTHLTSPPGDSAYVQVAVERRRVHRSALADRDSPSGYLSWATKLQRRLPSVRSACTRPSAAPTYESPRSHFSARAAVDSSARIKYTSTATRRLPLRDMNNPSPVLRRRSSRRRPRGQRPRARAWPGSTRRPGGVASASGSVLQD